MDGVPSEAATAPINLQLIPTDAFVRIRGWSLPLPVLPLSIMGSWGGRGTISGGGEVKVPQGQISNPNAFQFQRDINGEEETMTVTLSPRGDWTGNVNPLNGRATMHMPTTLRVQASHVRMVDIPWPGGWIYGNIDCTVPLEFGPMTTAGTDPPDPNVDPAPVTAGARYQPDTGQFSVVNNSMSIGGFNCTRPDIGSGKVEDELNGAVAIPAPPGRTDARFNLTFLEGGNVIRPKPAIRPSFKSLQGAPYEVAFDASESHVKAGVARYVWDMDGDGAGDVFESGPHLTQGFPETGPRKVGLRIVDMNGDVSPWFERGVVVGARAGAGIPRLAPLKVTPKKLRARPGGKVRFKVRVRNSGLGTAGKAKVCVTAPKRLATVKKRCRAFPELAPGETRTPVFRAKLSKRAAGRGAIQLRIKASAASVKPVKAKVRVRVG